MKSTLQHESRTDKTDRRPFVGSVGSCHERNEKAAATIRTVGSGLSHTHLRRGSCWCIAPCRERPVVSAQRRRGRRALNSRTVLSRARAELYLMVAARCYPQEWPVAKSQLLGIDSGSLQMKRPLQHARHSGHEYRHLRTDGRVPACFSVHADTARLSGHPMRLVSCPLDDSDSGGTRTRVSSAPKARR